MAGKGELGIELDLDKVPCREKNMSAYEIMLSESQERMLMIIEPKKEHIAKEVFDKWELDFSVIGKLTNTNKMVINHERMKKAEIVLDILEKGAPSYKRPYSINKYSEEKINNEKLIDKDPISILKDLIGSPNLCSRKWVWEQYDHMVMTDTILIPGGDSAIIRVHGTNKGLSITSDSTPRYCLSDPIEGGKQAVAEAWRNLIAVGSRPIAITDCMNFGNPEKEEIMGQFAGVVKGMIMSCNELDFPVVSGNVSLYNETNGKGINPTPVIGGVGVINNLDIFADHNFKRKDDIIIIIGKTDGHLSQSIYATELLNINTGLPPKVNLAEEKKNGLTIKSLIESSLVDTSHDVSDGGILIALTEMAIKNNIGFEIETDKSNSHRFLFGEDQGRYIVSIKEKNLIKVKKILEENNVIYTIAGVTVDKIIKVNEEKIHIDMIKEIYENWFTRYLSE